MQNTSSTNRLWLHRPLGCVPLSSSTSADELHKNQAMLREARDMPPVRTSAAVVEFRIFQGQYKVISVDSTIAKAVPACR
jgi:hypothetical protein